MNERIASHADIQEREFEDKIAHRYNRDYHEPPIMAEHSRAFADYVARYVKPGDRMLDLGCGAASMWTHWHEQLPELGCLVGVDLSPGMLNVAREAFPSGDFREGSFVDIPSGPGEFDIVVVSSAFHHICDTRLPTCLQEIHRVSDEHGLLLGREPLKTSRLGDRGGWFAGALMHLRHLTFRLSGTREYPEPDPGPEHHAYDPQEFLKAIDAVLSVIDVEFKNPVSPFLSRVRDNSIAQIALHLDSIIMHREGQEIHYAARKNFSTAKNVSDCINQALSNNRLDEDELREFMANVVSAAKTIEKYLPSDEKKWEQQE